MSVDLTKEIKVLAYLRGEIPVGFRDREAKEFEVTADEVKSFVIGLPAAKLRQYMTDKYGATVSAKISEVLRLEAEDFLKKHPESAPRQPNVAKLAVSIFDDIQPSEISRG